jgi:hypothetical protein
MRPIRPIERRGADGLVNAGGLPRKVGVNRARDNARMWKDAVVKANNMFTIVSENGTVLFSL